MYSNISIILLSCLDPTSNLKFQPMFVKGTKSKYRISFSYHFTDQYGALSTSLEGWTGDDTTPLFRENPCHYGYVLDEIIIPGNGDFQLLASAAQSLLL